MRIAPSGSPASIGFKQSTGRGEGRRCPEGVPLPMPRLKPKATAKRINSTAADAEPALATDAAKGGAVNLRRRRHASTAGRSASAACAPPPGAAASGEAVDASQTGGQEPVEVIGHTGDLCVPNRPESPAKSENARGARSGVNLMTQGFSIAAAGPRVIRVGEVPGQIRAPRLLGRSAPEPRAWQTDSGSWRGCNDAKLSSRRRRVRG